jgi:hypothetical protein
VKPWRSSAPQGWPSYGCGSVSLLHGKTSFRNAQFPLFNTLKNILRKLYSALAVFFLLKNHVSDGDCSKQTSPKPPQEPKGI